MLKFFIFMIFVSFGDAAHEFKTHNACPFPVWVGTLGNSGKPAPGNGGYRLNQGQTHSVQVGRGWGGRFWGRTSCDESTGRCVTGDCGNKIACAGAGGVPPVTLAEFTLDGWQNQDFYDVSLVDGYNLPMQIKPINGQKTNRPDRKFDCNNSGCRSDLNARCPQELAVKSGGRTVACKSACEAFRTDQYCCRGAFNTPQTCKSSAWPKNYPAMFKEACPDAYSYAYDDAMSTYTCKSHENSGYEIIFCP